jgi:hypothetical protein
MTTAAIQSHVGIDNDMKVLLEYIISNPGGGSAASVQTDLDAVEASVIVDLGNLRTAVIAALTALDTLATKLNADAGVTDTNYATNNVSGSSPAAITTA